MVLNVGQIIKASEVRKQKAQCAEALRVGVYGTVGKAETLLQFKHFLFEISIPYLTCP